MLPWHSTKLPNNGEHKLVHWSPWKRSTIYCFALIVPNKLTLKRFFSVFKTPLITLFVNYWTVSLIMDRISWPSERIPHGGLFHAPKVNYSKATHDMIKGKLVKSKISIELSFKFKYFQLWWKKLKLQWCKGTRSITFWETGILYRYPKCKGELWLRKLMKWREHRKFWVAPRWREKDRWTR